MGLEEDLGGKGNVVVSGRRLQFIETCASVLDRSIFFIRWTNSIGIVILAMMVCLTFIDVFLRYVFRRPLTGSTDITALMLAAIVLLGIAYTELHKGHVNIDLVLTRLSQSHQIVIKIITCFMSICLFALLTWRGLIHFLWILKMDEKSYTLHIPYAPVALLVPIGCGLVILVLARDLLNLVAQGIRANFRRRLWIFIFGITALVMASLIFWMQPFLWHPSLATVGLIGIVVVFVFFAAGMPIGFALAMVALVFLGHIRGLDAALALIGSIIFRTTNNYWWSVLTFFFLMGYLVFFSGLGEDMFYAAYKWFGHLSGGLGVATIVACTGLAAIVGDTLSGCVIMGTVALPEMKKYRYDPNLTAGCIAAGGTLGALIPPSITLMIYGLLTLESIGDLLLAGFIPGFILSFGFISLIYSRCRLNPRLGPGGERSNWRLRLVSLKAAGPILALFLLVIGGLYIGLFTPTEAGGIGAFGTLAIGMLMRRYTWQKFSNALIETSKITAFVFVILSGSMLFGYFLAASRLSIALGDYVGKTGVPPITVVIGILVFYLICGCFLPSIPTVLITVPIFYPVVVKQLGLDPIWFGVLVAMMTNWAEITPPFGMNLFTLKAVAPEIPISTIYRGCIPFCYVTAVVVALIVAFPSLATWLPNALKFGR